MSTIQLQPDASVFIYCILILFFGVTSICRHISHHTKCLQNTVPFQLACFLDSVIVVVNVWGLQPLLPLPGALRQFCSHSSLVVVLNSFLLCKGGLLLDISVIVSNAYSLSLFHSVFSFFLSLSFSLSFSHPPVFPNTVYS